MDMDIPLVTLRNNVRIPILGLGTYRLTGTDCTNAVKLALRSGYRHIDTADLYGNHEQIAEGIRGFDRKELFITSKVWHSNLHFEDVIKSCDKILAELRTGYVDLLLIHWPNKSVPLKETLNALNIIYTSGKTRAIGVSNFTIRHLKDAQALSTIPICVNQVEFHPLNYQKELLLFCHRHGIALTAYSPIARGLVFDISLFRELADKYGKSCAQISLRWLIQKGIIAIPKATTLEHLKENMDIFDFELARQDILRMDDIKLQKRLVMPGISEFDYN